MGKPDPVVLQKVIRELKEELAVLKAKPGKDFRDAEIRRLRDEYVLGGGRRLGSSRDLGRASTGLTAGASYSVRRPLWVVRNWGAARARRDGSLHPGW